MKKVSTAAAKQRRNFSQPKLSIGLDLGDRNSWYCVVDEGGQIQLEQRVRTSAKALQEVFGGMPRCRIALEIGTHSPWVSRLLGELGHEVIVANARKVRLIGESRKKDDRLDAQTLWKKRKEASDRGDGKKAGGVAASSLGQRRSVRAIAQQPSNGSCGSCVKRQKQSQNRSRTRKSKSPKPSSGDCVYGLGRVLMSERQVANQMAAPAELRTPNMHRAKRFAPRECGWKHGDSDYSAGKEFLSANKNQLTMNPEFP